MFPNLVMFTLPYLEWVVQIRAYPTLHLLALVVLVVVTLRNSTRDIGPPWPVVDAFLIGVPAGMLGAVLLGGWTSGEAPRNPLELPIFWQIGNKAAYGGLLAGVAAGALTARLRGVPVRRLLDAAAPGLALAIVCARIGCFLAGCCYGAPTDSWLGVRFPDAHHAMREHVGEALALHPTQLYLAGAALGSALLLLCLRRRRTAPGTSFQLFVALYAASILLIEPLRADPDRYFLAGWSHSQWISAALLAGLLAAALWRRRAPRPRLLAAGAAR